MPEKRTTIAAGENYAIEFSPRGSGVYYATVKGEENGPFPNEDAAKRYVINKLEGLVNSFDEDEAATRQALTQADLVEGQQNAAAEAGDPDWRNAGDSRDALAEADAQEEAELRAEQERKRQEEALAQQAAQGKAQEDADAQRAAQLEAAREARRKRREGTL